MDLVTALLVLVLGLALGLALGALLGVLWSRSRPALVDGAVDAAVGRAEVADGLDRLGNQLRLLEHARSSWQGQLAQQVDDMRHTTDLLRRETSSLATALRKPQVRGRWGEMHLRRAVELAGLVDRCDFTEQARLHEGALRPDLLVHLAGGRSIVVDAKVPLDAFLDATSADDEDAREMGLLRHARQLRSHVDALAGKAYWRQLTETPDFVVMFIPAEAFLSAALEEQADLIDYAAERRVVLATPTTLIALLRTVAHGWSHETLAAQAADVQRLGRELHERLGTLGSHLDKVGRSLGTAVSSYNQAVGSLEGRVLVSARRFSELGVTDDGLEAPRQVDQAPRSLSAPELVDPPAPPGLSAEEIEVLATGGGSGPDPVVHRARGA